MTDIPKTADERDADRFKELIAGVHSLARSLNHVRGKSGGLRMSITVDHDSAQALAWMRHHLPLDYRMDDQRHAAKAYAEPSFLLSLEGVEFHVEQSHRSPRRVLRLQDART